jgi:hypothetical protein
MSCALFGGLGFVQKDLEQESGRMVRTLDLHILEHSVAYNDSCTGSAVDGRLR